MRFLADRRDVALLTSIHWLRREATRHTAWRAVCHACAVTLVDLVLAYGLRHASASATSSLFDYGSYAIRLCVVCLLVAFSPYLRTDVFSRGSWSGPGALWALRLTITAALVLTAVIVVALAAMLLLDVPWPQPAAGFVDLGDHVEVAGLAGIAVVVAPVMEEVLYRGLLVGAISRACTPAVAVAVSVIVFAFLHAVPYGYGWFVPIQAFGGLVTGIAFCTTRSIGAAIIIHAGGNAYLGGCMLAQLILYRMWPGPFQC